MRPATGSNVPQTIQIVSVQPKLDGHSFSKPQIIGDYSGQESVRVEWITARTMLVPSALFESDNAGKLLAANGMAPHAGDHVLYSEPQQNIVAVMAVGDEAVNLVAQELGARATHSTPLLREFSPATASVWLYRIGELLYCKVYNGRLRMAEVIPAPSKADVCYFVKRLGEEFKLTDFTLVAAGEDAKALTKSLKRYFKQVTCE